ncbi:autoinducer-2 kinase [Deinococcus detaillensis]|uniref:Autoinducer-2 kinase n=1 Tax=Deinococcus detaillensis TaxID=2592048 RepID=A0A553UIW3_9DEIO|nr:autoinducer-2 kinase [Deinococcus detaillensis]TSA80126.1 autoinducer-2 kinase [Deinococcus detaillensis]
MSGFLLAIDAGTGSVRAVLFTPQGQQVAVAAQEWTHENDGTPGVMDFAVERNWGVICQCIQRVMAQAGATPESILAVSASSMREAIVLYDESGREIWACANVDARAAEQVRLLQRDHAQVERQTYQESGQTFALSAVPRLLWIKQHQPEVFGRIHRVSMLSDWVLYRLGGVLASDPSNACTSGMFSLLRRDWSRVGLNDLGLPDELFPPVLESGTAFSAVTPRAAGESGLRPGTPVVMGGGDVQLGCVGLGVVRPGQTAILGGTFWQQEVNLAEPKTDPAMDIRINCHAVPGVWQAETISFFVGAAMRWFRDTYCDEERRQEQLGGRDAYSSLEEQARQVPPGAYGIIPIFSDVMRYSAWYHAAPSFLNLSLDPVKSSRGALFRALEEHAAVVSVQNLLLIQQFTHVDSEVLTFAGGGSKGELWCQILADVSGKPVRVPVVKEATALGTAIAAGTGVGVYASLAEGGEALVSWERTYQPNRALGALYAELTGRWQIAYAAQRSLVDQGITTSLWKAPGL